MLTPADSADADAILPDYISPEPARLNGTTFPAVSLPSAAVNPDYASSASAQMVQHRLGDFEAHAEAL